MKWFRNNPSEEDIALFRSCERFMGEEDLYLLMKLLSEERAFYAETRKRLLDFLSFFDDDAHRFVDRRLQRLLEPLLKSLSELKIVTATHFFVFPRNQTGSNLRHCLHPDYFILEMHDISIDEHRFFLRAEKQLELAVEKATAHYEIFRKGARKWLHL
jgi:hypothetical protein